MRRSAGLPPGFAKARIDADGRVWLNDQEIPNVGVTLTIKPDSIATLDVSVPIVNLTLPDDAVIRLAISVSEPLYGMVQATGDDVSDALRNLATALDAAIASIGPQ